MGGLLTCLDAYLIVFICGAMLNDSAPRSERHFSSVRVSVSARGNGVAILTLRAVYRIREFSCAL